jgi:chromosome segregation ATPase
MSTEELVAVERNALQALDELELVAALDSFRRDFEHLVKTLRKVRDAERETSERVTQLQADLDVKRRAKEGAEQERADLEGARQQLNDEIGTLQGDLSRLKESSEDARKRISEARAASKDLDVQINAGAGWTDSQAEERDRLEDAIDRQQQLVDARREQTVAIELDVQVLQEHLKVQEAERQEVQAELQALSAEIDLKKKEASRLQAKKEERDIELRQVQLEAEALGRRVREAAAEASDAEGAAVKEQDVVKTLRSHMEKLVKAYEALHSEVGKLTAELDAHGHTNEIIAKELVELDGKLRERQAEVEEVLKDSARVKEKHAKAARMIDAQGEKHSEVLAQDVALKEQCETVLAAARAESMAAKAVSKEIEKRQQERELLRKAISSEIDATTAVDLLVSEHVSSIASLKSEVRGFRDAVMRQRDQIDTIRGERARFAADCEAASERYLGAASDGKQADLKIGQLQRKLAEIRSKVRAQEHLLESVRADRLAYGKTLRTSESEIETMKRQFQSTSYRIEQLKDELMSKDHKLVKEHFEFKKTEKDCERVAAELATLQNQVRSAEHLLGAQDSEVVKLQRIVKEAEDEMGRQRKELSAVVSERDVLQGQLVRRDEELTALYEKLKIQKSALARGAAQWSARQSDHKESRQRVSELQAEVELARAQVSSLEDMRREMKRLEAALTREKSKIRSLTDEMERPVNVHRWRAMQVVDPDRYKLIQRVHALQRRILDADEEVSKRDLGIQEKERLYVELKEAVARQPGAEVDEEIDALQDDLKAKQKNLRSMEEERETQKQLADELQRDLERIKSDCRKLDTAWTKQVRASQRLNELQAQQAQYAAALGLSLPAAAALGGDEEFKVGEV